MDFHYNIETVFRPPNIYNGIPFTGNTVSLYAHVPLIGKSLRYICSNIRTVKDTRNVLKLMDNAYNKINYFFYDIGLCLYIYVQVYIYIYLYIYLYMSRLFSDDMFFLCVIITTPSTCVLTKHDVYVYPIKCTPPPPTHTHTHTYTHTPTHIHTYIHTRNPIHSCVAMPVSASKQATIVFWFTPGLACKNSHTKTSALGCFEVNISLKYE